MTELGNLFHLPQPARPLPFPGQARDRWQNLRRATPRLRRHILSGAPLVRYFRGDPASAAFDALRTELSLKMRENGWTRISVTSPTRQCGTTFATANLGQSFSAISGQRTLLVDLNLRTPGLLGALDLEAGGDMAAFLSGELQVEQHLVRVSDTLALAPATRPEPDAAGILLGRRFGLALDRMTAALTPDAVFFDMAPMLDCCDVETVLPRMDAVLLIAGAGRTTAAEIAECRRRLEGKAPLLGVVLNGVPGPARPET